MGESLSKSKRWARNASFGRRFWNRYSGRRSKGESLIKGFTGENGRKTDMHSTGLGLYLAKNLAKELGIELTISSVVGEGTTVTLYFPLLSYYQENR